VDKTHSFVNAFLISAGIAFAAALVYIFVVRTRIEDSETVVSPVALSDLP